MRTALYARVSTSDKGQDPEMQLRELREYCDRRGWQIVGEYVRRALPQNAVVITTIQSGSIRWYGQRMMLRWDLVEDERLDRAIDVLRSHGYEPYILLEDYEEPDFRRHFQRASALGRIDWPPAIEYKGLPNVRVYAIADRARYLAGERIFTHALAASN